MEEKLEQVQDNSPNPIENEMTIRYSVLFVCTYNISRSPLGEALFRNMLQQSQSDWRAWRVGSAGTWVQKDSSPIPVLRGVFKSRGIPYTPRFPQPLSARIIQQHRLILVMETGHKEALLIEKPHLSQRVFLFSEMIGLNVSIPDPIKERNFDYGQLADLMESWMTSGLEKIRVLAEHRDDSLNESE
jgi:protein-tyrosine phosphatase